VDEIPADTKSEVHRRIDERSQSMPVARFSVPDLTVLVIDDDEGTRLLLTKLLAIMGVGSAIEAADGFDGLGKAFSEGPDIIVCDISMEPIDGMAVLGALKASLKEAVQTIPVVMFTASGDKALLKKAMLIGARGAIQKPFAPDKLSEYLRLVADEAIKAKAHRKEAQPQNESTEKASDETPP
jgi:two-component system chemotaxis response regulator CheY